MSAKGLTKRIEKYDAVLESISPAYLRSLHLCEYLFVLPMPQPLREKIAHVKQYFAEKYNAKNNTGGRAHIALAKCSTWSMMEEKLITRLELITMATSPFLVELQDYKAIPTHTIHIGIRTQERTKALIKELKTAQRLMKADPLKEPHFFDHPLVPVAQKLLPWQYEKGWQEMSHKQFTGRFVADAMLVLKRREGEINYQIIKRLELQGLPVAAKQGALIF